MRKHKYAGPTAEQVRERLNHAFELNRNEEKSDRDKIVELWAIISDIQLWMLEMEKTTRKRRS